MTSRIVCFIPAFAMFVASTLSVDPSGYAWSQGIEDLRTKGEPVFSNQEILDQLTNELREYDRQLQSLLMTRFPEEKAFVDSVVLEVHKGTLPKSVVDSAWLWVRQKRPGTPYPFVYFERVLRLEGERLKLEIPPFDREIYNRGRQARNPEIRDALRR